METKILLAGMELLLLRKRIKNMYLRVLPPDGEVRLTAPLRTSEVELAGFVAKHASWVRQKQKELRERIPEKALAYCSGERHLLWGRPYELLVRSAERKSGRFS